MRGMLYSVMFMAARNVQDPFARDLVEPLLRRVLLAIVIAASLIAITSAVMGVTRVVIAAAINAAVASIMILIVRKGLLLAACITQSAVLTASSVYVLVSGYGLLDIGILVLPSLFLLTSVLLSARWTLVVALTADATVLAIGLAEKWGWLVTPNSALVQYEDIVDAVILLTTTAVFAQYLVSTLRRSIVQARLAQAKTRDILDATSDAIVIHDAKDGRIVEVNETTLKMFGCSREDLLGQVSTNASVDSLDYLQRATEYIQRAVSQGPQSFEWLARSNGGDEFWIEVMLRRASIADDACVVAVLRDITTRRRLEQRVREAETFRAVGQLAGGVAHDFNNQLMGIMGNAEFLRESVQCDTECAACIDSILASSRRAADLTQQLLAFARRGRRRNVPVDLHRLIAEVISLGRRSIDKRITIEQHLSAERAVSQGDPSALQNALLNLLVNARDAMALGGTVAFTTRNVDLTGDAASALTLASGQYIEIDVADTGAGIGMDVIGRVFEPFFTTKESGTGMGLAAVQGTVLEHQGSVEIISTPGQGATFRLRLPVIDAVVASEPARATKVLAESRQGRVLVVDDETAVTGVVALALQRGGYEVEVCNGGQQALHCYKTKQFDFVLLDVMMPDLDGVEVLRRLRAVHPTARVMLMTGHAEDSVQARLKDFPDVTVIAKPFLPRELMEVIKRVSLQWDAVP